MSYDEKLAQRLRDAIGGAGRITEKRMMGGLCLLMHGHMVCGIDRDRGGNDRLMFRVGKQNEARALKRPGASIVDMGGRRIGGFIYVEADACRGRALAAWIKMACDYIAGMPPKPAARPAARSTPRKPKAPARRR